jgi:hypothetical protein
MKETVKNKIIYYCEKYKIKTPDFNNYYEVKKTADIINNTCPFCGKKNKGPGYIICSCEIKKY